MMALSGAVRAPGVPASIEPVDHDDDQRRQCRQSTCACAEDVVGVRTQRIRQVHHHAQDRADPEQPVDLVRIVVSGGRFPCSHFLLVGRGVITEPLDEAEVETEEEDAEKQPDRELDVDRVGTRSCTKDEAQCKHDPRQRESGTSRRRCNRPEGAGRAARRAARPCR